MKWWAADYRGLVTVFERNSPLQSLLFLNSALYWCQIIKAKQTNQIQAENYFSGDLKQVISFCTCICNRQQSRNLDAIWSSRWNKSWEFHKHLKRLKKMMKHLFWTVWLHLTTTAYVPLFGKINTKGTLLGQSYNPKTHKVTAKWTLTKWAQ